MQRLHSETQLDLFAETAVFSPREIDQAIRFARAIQAVTFSCAIVAAGAAVFKAVRRLGAAVAAHRQAARTRALLSNMDARQLADIGLCRGDIDAVVAGHDPLVDRRAVAKTAAPLLAFPTVEAVRATTPAAPHPSSLAA